jgi:acyl-CoA synthetase (AMP-forming)/AMP-acid ligase II
VLLPGERLDTAIAWDLIARHGVTNMFTVPTILNMLVADPAAAPHRLRHVIYAGAPMYRADQLRAMQRLGSCLVQYFGLGEVTGCITVLRPDQHSPADEAPGALSVGAPRTGMDIAILDEAGAHVECGEICVRGPGVFAGYFQNDAANEKAFRQGWFHTGDLGFLDPQGFLHITGRASDMFISGGSNIYPREVEEALLTHPAVAECAVVGLPDPRWGESGVACLVLRAPTAPEALLAHLEGRLARYKHPRRFVTWEALPKSAYGKVPKTLLAERLRAEAVGFDDSAR